MVSHRLKNLFPSLTFIKTETSGLSEPMMISSDDYIVFSLIVVIYLFTGPVQGYLEINVFVLHSS